MGRLILGFLDWATNQDLNLSLSLSLCKFSSVGFALVKVVTQNLYQVHGQVHTGFS